MGLELSLPQNEQDDNEDENEVGVSNEFSDNSNDSFSQNSRDDEQSGSIMPPSPIPPKTTQVSVHKDGGEYDEDEPPPPRFNSPVVGDVQDEEKNYSENDDEQDDGIYVTCNLFITYKVYKGIITFK